MFDSCRRRSAVAPTGVLVFRVSPASRYDKQAILSPAEPSCRVSDHILRRGK